MGKLELMQLVALVAINHDGTLFGPGQEAGAAFECTEAQAAPLLEVGAACRPGEESKAVAAPSAADVSGPTPDPEQLQAQAERDAALEDVAALQAKVAALQAAAQAPAPAPATKKR